MLIAILSIPFLTASSVIVPFLVLKISNAMIVNRDFQQILFWLGILIFSVFISMIFEFCYSFFLQFNAQKSILAIRQDLFERIIYFPKKFFDKEPLGKILSRLTSDFENVQESLAIGVLSFITDLIKTIFLMILLYFINYRLAIVVTLFFPVIFFLTQFIRQLMKTAYIIARSALASAAAYLGECIQGMQMIQLYLAEEKIIRTYTKKNNEFFIQQKKINFYESALFSLVEAISIICLLFILWYSSYLSLNDLVTISVILAFMSALQKCFIPLRELFQQISTLQRAISSLHQIELLFLEKMEPKITYQKKEDFKELKSICFDRVSFRYPNQKNYVLKNISFKLKAKEKLALVGATGSGKSTIIRILTKQYENYEGSIKINGIEFSKIPRELMTNFCSVSFQDVFLFNESIEFNVGFGKQPLTKVKKALDYVKANTFVNKLPKKEKFIIQDNGKNISSGQAQLLNLARISAQEKELFLLDEVTSSVDTVTAKKISDAMKKIFSQKTTIAIAHQLNTIQQADKILVLEQGQIIEEGNHHSLFAKKGIYFHLVKNKI